VTVWSLIFVPAASQETHFCFHYQWDSELRANSSMADDPSVPRWLQQAKAASAMQERDEHTWMRLIGHSDDVLGEPESGGASPAAGVEERERGKYGRAPLHGYAEEQEASDALAAAEVLASFGTIAGVQAVTNSSFQPPFLLPPPMQLCNGLKFTQTFRRRWPNWLLAAADQKSLDEKADTQGIPGKRKRGARLPSTKVQILTQLLVPKHKH